MPAQQSQKPKLRIQAQNIGPILSLDGELSEQSQNMIFARNGSGKSFIARSLRLLEQGPSAAPDGPDVANSLISQESLTRTGFFKLFEGERCIGSVDLDGESGVAIKEKADYLFYIFSEDFIDDNVRNKLGSINPDITHEIIIGGENAELDELKNDLNDLQARIEEQRTAFKSDFENDREKLRENIEISRALNSYKKLIPEEVLSGNIPDRSDDSSSLEELIEQYKLYKSLPANPQTPQEISIDSAIPDLSDVESSISRETSPSTISDKLRKKIELDPDFFGSGLRLHRDSDDDECPFCEQSLSLDALHLLNEYEKFFSDEESKHRRELENQKRSITHHVQNLEKLNKQSLEAKVRFDDLKKYFPSMAASTATDLTPYIESISNHLKDVIATIDNKLNDLRAAHQMPRMREPNTLTALTENVKSNTEIYQKLTRLTENSRNERISIQNDACEAFLVNIAEKKASDIDNLLRQQTDYNEKLARCIELERSHGEKRAARDVVAETFKMLLKSFFDDKYSFDETNFSIKRKGVEIRRGVDKSLSDGEKSVIGFCYFLAHIHLKVESIDDYKNLFLIIDDPVSSLSFDYIHSIAQCLKRLRITKDGEIELSIAANLIRPKILILTHNNQFYNVCSSNNVVKSHGLFQLIPRDEGHLLRNQKSIATPHMSQLKDVLEVSERRGPPDHTTPNSIRSVIETMWRFCRPDIQDFETFSMYLSSDHGLEIKTILLHEHSHGGKADIQAPLEDDVIRAAQEAIEVVRRFAPGQLYRLQTSGKQI